MASLFKKAVKSSSKGRVALVGPSGVGKSYTMLILATLLAGPDGTIAAVDTEHGSLSKYADKFDFDVVEMSSFKPQNFLTALHAAEAAGYSVFCVDSLSHFWMGKDGALEFVDMASKRHRDQMGGWKDFRPFEREMIDAMISSPCHVIVTMRTKTDYQEVIVDGKKKRVKIGLAPVQRDGLEYEFDLVGYMDEENTLNIDKTRCSDLAGQAITKPQMQDLEVFRTWLEGEARPAAEPARQASPPVQQPAPRSPRAPRTPAAKPPATVNTWAFDNGKLLCVPTNAALRKALNDEDVMAVKLNGFVDARDMAFCQDPSLFDALNRSVGQPTELQLRKVNGMTNIVDVMKVGAQLYRDGIRVQGKEVDRGNPDADPPPELLQ